jgi:hypothetical protein
MNLVVMSNCTPPAWYMIEQLRHKWPVRAIIRPLWSRAPTAASPWKKVIENPLAAAQRRLYRACSDPLIRRRDQEICRRLFGVKQLTPTIGVIDLPTWAVNAPSGIELLRELKPDYLIVNGGPILKADVLAVPRYGAVNIHYGIAPQYRGENTIFWPLYYGDHDHLGITLHHIENRVDGGHLLAHGFPALEATDSEASLWVKCSRLSATLICSFLAAADGTRPPGIRQQEKGRQFNGRARTPWHDLHYAFKRQVLKQFPIPRDERVITYF